jgi:hypothetical protein
MALAVCRRMKFLQFFGLGGHFGMAAPQVAGLSASLMFICFLLSSGSQNQSGSPEGCGG